MLLSQNLRKNTHIKTFICYIIKYIEDKLSAPGNIKTVKVITIIRFNESEYVIR